MLQLSVRWVKRFHSLQTGKHIASKKRATCRPEPLTIVSIPFKRESVWQVQTFLYSLLAKVWCFHSLQTGTHIVRRRSQSICVGNVQQVSIPFKRESAGQGERCVQKGAHFREVSIPFKRESAGQAGAILITHPKGRFPFPSNGNAHRKSP